jgi:GT2 family glycosyltransferase
MTISVIIPTYKRKNSLERCLKALKGQKRKPDEVIIVVREEDKETIEYLKSEKIHMPELKMVYVNQPGQVYAMNAGLEEASGEIICFTDDDAEPFPDWLEKLEKWYEDKDVGGVGGRDIIITEDRKIKSDAPCKKVGKLQWFGRTIGNHHLSLNPSVPVEVDILKGVNMSFRSEILKKYKFDMILNNYSSVHNDLDMSLNARKEGYKLIYDPEIKVYHYAVPRITHKREDEISIYEHSFATVYVLLKHLSLVRKLVFLLYFFLIGQRASYGPILFLYDSLKGRRIPFKILKTSIKGKFDGLKRWILNILS